jgi:hypothetical protein
MLVEGEWMHLRGEGDLAEEADRREVLGVEVVGADELDPRATGAARQN